MDIIVIFNGLGNQMSQYAFYLQKKKVNENSIIIFDTNSKDRHNGFELNDVFGIKYKNSFSKKLLVFFLKILMVKRWKLFVPVKAILSLMGFRLFSEKQNYEFELQNLAVKKGINFYYGGWHSAKNFLDVIPQVRKSFEFNVVDELNLGFLKEINSCESVSIHIRKGDYMNAENYSTFGAVCSKRYFEAAITTIEGKINKPKYFIFTNDKAWVVKNIVTIEYVLVDINLGKNSWKDMFLMSNCKHNINSNSSFSWWAAFLNKNPNKVIITPKDFIYGLDTPDVYPNDWIKIDNYDHEN